MAYWIFKQARQDWYPDEPGKTYVYDNRHSVRVAAGDDFVYLDKRDGGYRFYGHGRVGAVQEQPIPIKERLHPRARTMYTARIEDYVEYLRPLDIRTTSATGRSNRAVLGIVDANRLGWSRSIAGVGRELFTNIIDLVYESDCIATPSFQPSDYSLPDHYSWGRRRHAPGNLRTEVLRRQNFSCAICGSGIRQVLDAAHISRYAVDIDNRANPANVIGLCAYCHRAFDAHLFILEEDGTVWVSPSVVDDPIANAHLTSLSKDERRDRIQGIDFSLLRHRYSGVDRRHRVAL